MKDKLYLTDIRENHGSHRRSTAINVYGTAHDIIKDLSARTGQTQTMIANKLICFAANHVVIDTEEEDT